MKEDKKYSWGKPELHACRKCSLITLTEEEEGTMSRYYNPGKVNLEEAERGIMAAGGGKTVDHIHKSKCRQK